MRGLPEEAVGAVDRKRGIRFVRSWEKSKPPGEGSKVRLPCGGSRCGRDGEEWRCGRQQSGFLGAGWEGPGVLTLLCLPRANGKPWAAAGGGRAAPGRLGVD
jgi:hypothetical protein